MKLKERLYKGLGTGSFIYMIVLLSRNNSTFITKTEIISVLLISACAGIFTFIFDVERISYVFALVIHFFIMILVIFLISLYNHWIGTFPTADFFESIVLIYAFSWFISYLNTKKDAEELNMLLKNNKSI